MKGGFSNSGRREAAGELPCSVTNERTYTSLQRLPFARDWKERSLMLRADIVKCPGFRAGTAIVTWWLTTPTKATPYLLSQIRNDFLKVLFVMCFCYFHCCIKALTEAAPKSRRIIGATFQIMGDSFFSVIFIHSVSSLLFRYCYFVIPISSLSLQVLPFIISCFLLPWWNQRFSKYSGLTMLIRTRDDYIMRRFIAISLRHYDYDRVADGTL